MNNNIICVKKNENIQFLVNLQPLVKSRKSKRQILNIQKRTSYSHAKIAKIFVSGN